MQSVHAPPWGSTAMDRRAGGLERALLWVLGVLLACAALSFAGQLRAPEPFQVGGITFDRLSATMTLLVAGVGIVAYRFALRYLDGEPGQRSFLRWLGFTVAMAYLLMLATNLLLLFAAWSLTSIGLHKLLTFYRQRPEVYRPARKKFLISRLGDLALLGAIALIWFGWGTLDVSIFTQAVAAGATNGPLTAVALLVVAAALTKSAQFPFHSWLPETMEAPTPVSALMHAGIINGGGVLLLRFAPLLALAPEALFFLALVGSLTALLGMLAMWAQSDVKRTLAWSTVSQMGFMMIQCGLGAFSTAALHIVGHGCYKAWAFLRTGGLPAKSAPAAAVSPARAGALLLLGTALAVPALALAGAVVGFDLASSPGKLALSAVVAVGIGQLWVALLGRPRAAGGLWAGGAASLLLTLAVALLSVALYRGAEAFFGPVFGALPVAHGPLAWAAALLPVVAIVLLTAVHALLPALQRTPTGRALAVHATHGFYLGQLANRLVDRIWMTVAGRSANRA